LANLLRQAAASCQSPKADEGPELAALIDVLERNEQRPVSDLVRVLQKSWPPPKAQKPKTPTIAADPSAFVKRLDAARDNPAEFQSLLAELLKSKALKAGDVAAIANRFRGSSKKYKTRMMAVEDVKKTWLEDRRDAEKIKKIKEVF